MDGAAIMHHGQLSSGRIRTRSGSSRVSALTPLIGRHVKISVMTLQSRSCTRVGMLEHAGVRTLLGNAHACSGVREVHSTHQPCRCAGLPSLQRLRRNELRCKEYHGPSVITNRSRTQLVRCTTKHLCGLQVNMEERVNGVSSHR